VDEAVVVRLFVLVDVCDRLEVKDDGCRVEG